jgi:uncharacterized protein YutE (UPF0331/DUF86 family)
MIESETSTRDLLEYFMPRYREEGFDVFINPSPSILPSFMQGYRPDAVALRPDKKIAIDLVRPGRPSEGKVRDLKSLFAPHRDWEFKILYVSSLPLPAAPGIVSATAIDEAITRVDRLKNDGHRLPALIMAWATLEAVGRALMPEQLKRPQTAGKLLEVLAEIGYLTPDEADVLRPAIALRDAAVHGGPDPVVDDKLLDQFIEVLRTLAEFLSPDRAPKS